MNYKKEFEEMMQVQTQIALATSVEKAPNVRILNFYYDKELKTLYFTSFTDNQKVIELEKNPRVAFTTIPVKDEEHVRVKNGIVKKSALSVESIKDKFLAKMPEYILNIPTILPQLTLFELTFDHADVVIDFEHMDNIAI